MLVINAWDLVDASIESLPAHTPRLPVLHLGTNSALLVASGLVLVRLLAQPQLLFHLNFAKNLNRRVIVGL